jgi:Uma2 family endonuclease
MSEMPAAQTETNVRTHPITVAEYYRMGEAGIIKPDERVELLDGELIPMPPIGPEHSYDVGRFMRLLVKRFDGRAFVGVQGPVRLDDTSEPQPDLVLLELPEERYVKAHPTPAQTLLVIEVAQSSLSYDRGRKLRAFARCGVREYWIVDLVHERIEVYREPSGERYRVHLRAVRGESVAPAAFPDDTMAVDDILPPA